MADEVTRRRPGLGWGRASVIACALGAALAGGPSAAHQLSVFAWIDGSEVVVEGKFSSGVRPKIGAVRVFDGEDRLIRTLEVEDGGARFPLDDAALQGLRIEMDTGEGHMNEWLLTPEDIATQRSPRP